MELWLIRHGETLWNREQRAQGQLDVPLSALGLEQAQTLAKRLQPTKFDALVSSDLQRAYQTAEIVAARLELPIRSDTAWREIHMGVGQGLTYSEIFSHKRTRPMTEPWEGGESKRDVMNRVGAALEKLFAEFAGSRVAVFSHGGAIRGAIHVLLNDLEQHLDLAERGNTSISKLEVKAGNVGRLLVYNDTAHLEG
jgi:2,3-bisphosphoglycerate-dependent phosphoglycerate mutase